MIENKQSVIILVADDDPDDRLMIKEALEEARLINTVHFVGDGEELLDYLKRINKYEMYTGYPLPGLILLDLNMPRKDGREALRDIKSDPLLHCIPTVILTTSKTEEDIIKTYNLGVNSYITKPVTFKALVEVMHTVTKYWLEIVELPANNFGN